MRPKVPQPRISFVKETYTTPKRKGAMNLYRLIKALASGAPVERESPLGYEVSWFTIVLLNVGQMVGTGVFSTPGSILMGIGSVGLSLIYWLVGVVIAMLGLTVYLELASYFPNRSGAEVVYLEQGWPKPKYFLPTTFAAFKVLFSFSSSNAIVLSTYLYRTAGATPTEWQSKGVAVAGYTLATLIVVFSTKYSLWFANTISAIKLLTLVFISITGFVVLAGGIKAIPDPGLNFRDSFAGTTKDAYGITNALVRINFAYAGWENCFNVVAEIKKPIRTVRWAGPASLACVGILYMFVNIAYFAAIPKKQIMRGNTITASLFFAKVFGSDNAARLFNILILLSAFGNLVSTLIGQSRMIRECGRQGVLPFPRFWASTQPFGTPLGPYALKYVMTILMIVAPPFGDAFNFAVDLASYPTAIFYLLMAIGVYTIRRQRARINAGRSEFRAWDSVVIVYIVIQVFLLAMPLVPPKGGINKGNVSFFYGTASLTSLSFFVICSVYYYVWMKVLPQKRGYEIRQELIVLDSGETTNSLVNVPLEKIPEWDRMHDAAGKKYATSRGHLSGEDSPSVERVNIKAKE
ncbi:related to methionine transport protein, high affinity [Rhynchosporium graminicola]|uniref:Related to methionine transport protein, high affinity n=1 Tax=Rhynchosporium graminicola TaxID=2792576 RepID=A0A1E1JVP5_9HELO|nr:related to methionine transport protein, high affinity [Rhynchosporium commune]